MRKRDIEIIRKVVKGEDIERSLPEDYSRFQQVKQLSESLQGSWWTVERIADFIEAGGSDEIQLGTEEIDIAPSVLAVLFQVSKLKAELLLMNPELVTIQEQIADAENTKFSVRPKTAKVEVEYSDE